MVSIISSIKDFLKSDFNKYLILFILIAGFASFFISVSPEGAQSEKMTVSFFYLPTCPHCTEQKPIIEELAAELTDVQFKYYDASSSEGSALFYKMASEAGLDTSRLGVPTIFIDKKAIVGFHTKSQILAAIEECRNECEANGTQKNNNQAIETSFSNYELPIMGRVNLTEFSLPVLAIVLGLIDGFNPCAMWVLVYLIGLLIGLNDRKKIWIIVGSFVASSGILYFLFMTAWLNAFLFIGYVRALTIIIGAVALGGGILSLKEYRETKGALVCKVGSENDHEKTMNRIDRIISQPITIALIVSIITLAFVVNSVEFLCSAAIPAVFTQILALNNLPQLQYYAYIGLYTLFFMLDDIIIFGLAAFAVSSSFGEKYAKHCKLLGGIVMILLGIMLLFFPNML